MSCEHAALSVLSGKLVVGVEAATARPRLGVEVALLAGEGEGETESEASRSAFAACLEGVTVMWEAAEVEELAESEAWECGAMVAGPIGGNA